MVNLRKIQESDLEMIMKWRMLPHITKYMYTDPELTIDMQTKWFKNISNDETCIYRIIQYNAEPIGLYSISSIDKKNETCFWAYYIAKDGFQGKGIGKIIECNNYDFCFDTLQLNKVCCEVLSFNDKVVKIHERFGASIEGVLRMQIKKDNEYYDVVRMGILKEEWQNKKKTIDYIKIAIS